MLPQTEREASQVWQEDPAMHQLHWVSGIKGSGFSHPPPLLALKEHNAHSASRGEGNQAAHTDVSDRPGQDASAQCTCVCFCPTHPGWLDPLSCMKVSVTCHQDNPSSLQFFPLSQGSRMHLPLRISFKNILDSSRVSGQREEEKMKCPGSGNF